jgi:hypothetical protein
MRARTGAVLGLLALGPGCGYALVGKGITTDPSIKRLGVPLFKDRTGKPGLDQKITQKVIEELQKRNRFTVVQEPSGVDALVEGEITAYTVTPVGLGTEGGTRTQASRYLITLVAKVTYKKIGQKDPIWASEGFSFRDEYDIGDAATGYFDREDQTIDRLGTAFARTLVAAMLEAF